MNLLVHGPHGSYELEAHIRSGRMISGESWEHPAEYEEDSVDCVILSPEDLDVTKWALRFIGAEELMYSRTKELFLPDLPSPVRGRHDPEEEILKAARVFYEIYCIPKTGRHRALLSPYGFWKESSGAVYGPIPEKDRVPDGKRAVSVREFCRALDQITTVKHDKEEKPT